MIEIRHKDKRIELEFDEYMQIGIIDMETANETYSIIEKYFTDHKHDAEIEITKDGYSVSGNRYKFIGLNSFKDIDTLLDVKKGTVFSNYNEIFLTEIDIEEKLLELEVKYQEIVEHIKSKYKFNDHINLEYKHLTKDILAMKNFAFEIDSEESLIDKFKILIRLMELLGNLDGNRYLLYLNHVEAYLTEAQLVMIKYLVKNVNNVFLVVATKNSSYLDFDDVENINFIYNGRSVNLPNLEYLEKKINIMINGNYKISINEIVRFLERHAFEVIEETYQNKEYDVKIFDAIISKNSCPISREMKMENTIII